MNIHQHNAGHMTKIAAMTIYGEHFRTFVHGNHRANLMKLSMKHQRPKHFKPFLSGFCMFCA